MRPLRVKLYRAVLAREEAVVRHSRANGGAVTVGIGIPARERPAGQARFGGGHGQRDAVGLLHPGKAVHVHGVGCRGVGRFVGVEHKGVLLRSPSGPQRFGGARLVPRFGGSAAGSIILRAAGGSGRIVETGKVITRPCGHGGGGHRRAVNRAYFLRCRRTAVAVQRDGTSVGRPRGNVAAVAHAAGGDRDACGSGRKLRAGPARKRIAVLFGIHQRDICRFNGISTGVGLAGRQLAFRQIVRDGIFDGAPRGGIAAVARAARGDGDRFRCGTQPRTGPARKFIAGLGGVVQRDGIGIDIIVCGVLLRERTTVQIIADSIRIMRPGCL